MRGAKGLRAEELRRAAEETRRLYGDIIDLPHPEPRNHLRMPRENRAAQFSPFAALTGYEDAIGEAGRLTDGEAVLDEDRQREISAELEKIASAIAAGDGPVRICADVYVPDSRKEGGAYITFEGIVKKVVVK